ncbi:unnamed protein product [Pleuronectes platessa]|uniref:Uncharacterized protein n=1 Tax=Pleuronectes platessa TaxID=8262 RepID=A0A9N7ZBU2_PLEPL|nr:unnamed protein product [Pleuronectes platessa]
MEAGRVDGVSETGKDEAGFVVVDEEMDGSGEASVVSRAVTVHTNQIKPYEPSSLPRGDAASAPKGGGGEISKTNHTIHSCMPQLTQSSCANTFIPCSTVTKGSATRGSEAECGSSAPLQWLCSSDLGVFRQLQAMEEDELEADDQQLLCSPPT